MRCAIKLSLKKPRSGGFFLRVLGSGIPAGDLLDGLAGGRVLRCFLPSASPISPLRWHIEDPLGGHGCWDETSKYSAALQFRVEIYSPHAPRRLHKHLHAHRTVHLIFPSEKQSRSWTEVCHRSSLHKQQRRTKVVLTPRNRDEMLLSQHSP
ncbi:hypothetical protein BCR34DRAFT_33367 [Clohesyomyces aquaticus]|uniref:Uncharacterized protein n=1 Tax=Clohesyomyces aquaticus TaxID=1231657 RepID=A0A1Y1Z8B4_9PLEO|nr:hypothetical protein BCR34DRAFT_33367 [Clohesyomyces aquaticus]